MKTLIAFVLITGSLFGQNIKSIATDGLPVKVVHDDTQLEMATKLLEQQSRIHPELIYLVLKSIQIRYDNSLSLDERRGLLRNIKILELRYRQRLNTWLQAEIEHLGAVSEAANEYYLADEAEDYFTNRLTLRKEKFGSVGAWTAAASTPEKAEPNADSLAAQYPLEIDENEMAYWAWRYFLPDNDETQLYSENIDYTSMRREKEAEKRDVHRRNFASLQTQKPASTGMSIDAIMDDWSLFEPSESEDFSFRAADYVLSTMRTKYRRSQPKKLLLGVILGYASDTPLSTELTIQNRNGTVAVSKRTQTVQIGLSLTYRFMFRDYLRPFSYIGLEVGGQRLINSGRNIGFNPGFSSNGFEQTGGGRRVSQSLTFNEGVATLNGFSSLEFRALAPVFVKSDIFVIEAGMLLRENRYDYDLFYNYNYRHVTQGATIGSGWVTIASINYQSGDVEESIETSERDIFPVLHLGLSVGKGLQMQGTLVPDFASIKLSYGLF